MRGAVMTVHVTTSTRAASTSASWRSPRCPPTSQVRPYPQQQAGRQADAAAALGHVQGGLFVKPVLRCSGRMDGDVCCGVVVGVWPAGTGDLMAALLLAWLHR